MTALLKPIPSPLLQIFNQGGTSCYAELIEKTVRLVYESFCAAIILTVSRIKTDGLVFIMNT